MLATGACATEEVVLLVTPVLAWAGERPGAKTRLAAKTVAAPMETKGDFTKRASRRGFAITMAWIP